MFPCIACHFPISLCQILHLATINVIIVTKVAGGNPIEFLLPEPSGTALFIFIQKQPLCRPSSQTVGVDLCIERFHHRHRGTARFLLTPGQGVLVFPNQMHGLKHVEPGQNLLCIFEPDFCHSFRQFFQNKKPAHNDFTVSSLSEHSRIALQGLKTLAAAMEKDRPTPSDVQVYAEGYLTLLLADLLPSLPLQVRKNTDDLELEQRLLLYLDAHYTEELSLESLSKEFGVSRFVLSRIFTEKLHTTFPDYVNSRRLDYARDLLLSTELSVTQIALDVGFGSSRTFFRAFHSAYHTTPGAYRRQKESS